MPTIFEETPKALQCIRTRDNKSNQPTPPPIKKKKTIAQYKHERELIKNATPTPMTNNPPNDSPPAYITQDDDTNDTANLLYQCLPHLEHNQNPLNISSKALYHLVGQSLEDEHLGAFTPAALALESPTW